MEEENEKLRKIATDMKNKYFEEKKVWQAKIRAALQKSTDAESVVNAESLPPPATSRMAVGEEESASIWNAKLAALQALAEAKSEEARELSIQNADLRLQLQQSGALNARSGITADSSADNADAEALRAAQSEARGLRQRCGELEITIRRNAREQERLSKTVQNQASAKNVLVYSTPLLCVKFFVACARVLHFVY